ncbi:flagellar hook-length control protein FliK [Arcobacter roscoffensis]|uniref:Flagellar hook-length control protein FliK n=1 Tax=Arcobacter roscoffensis TaxID=2961520 RepID=A0ABY5DZS3_9BACT|nr:flagellar hook-length control protein FliK [Arcobacter roscoffensis]UTJ05449.1 flagellar hook-length control protein FliK [Arcobacter roscoffensis]
MLVSNNSLLNVLLPNDNKALKEVLKEADSKTLQDMIKNKSVSVNDVLKNLFDDIKNGTKTNANIENILKNTNAFKDLGSFSKSLSSVLAQIDSNSNLNKFKANLESFLKNIANIDENTLKEQISKSGVFLESKIAQNTQNKGTLPANVEKLLTQIQNLVKDINSPIAKQVSELITKTLQQAPTSTNTKSTENLKALVPLLQNLVSTLQGSSTKDLSNLTNQLKNMVSQGSLLESKLDNLKTISSNNSANITAPTSKNEQTGINQGVLNAQTPKTKEVVHSSQTPTNQVSVLQNTKEQVNTQTKQLLNEIKTQFNINNASNPSATKVVNEQIDNLLKSNDLFAKNDKLIEPKALLNNLLNSSEIKQASNQNQNISNLVLNLKNISENISNLETKVQNFINVTSEKNATLSNLKENLASLKTELVNIKNVDLSVSNKIVSKLENLDNLFAKIENPNANTEVIKTSSLQTSNMPSNQSNISSSFPNNFANNLNSLILLLKESITNLTSNQNNPNAPAVQNQILEVVDKIESTIKESIQNSNINQAMNLNQTKESSNPLSNDMKSILLQMQDELASKTDQKSQEIFKQVDKMLMQIDYHQLLSMSSNSNYVYVPFLWDMLEEGSIGIKKSKDEEKFYCQIHLTLKDFGKVDLMMGLYDKNKIDITIYAQREHFKEKVRDNLQTLKKSLNKVDLIPVNIKLLDLKEENKTEDKPTQTYNKNAYDNSSFSSGIDIRV